MSTAVAFDVDPSNSENALVLMDDGHIVAKGDAIDPHIDFDFNPWIGKDLQVIDWTTPSGYALEGRKGIHNFGSAVQPGNTLSPGGTDVARAMSMHPDGNGQGYVLLGDGTIEPVGGASNIVQGTTWPGFDVARDLQMKWDDDGTTPKFARYVLDKYGAVHVGGGAVALTGSEQHGYATDRDHARRFKVVDWDIPIIVWLDINGQVWVDAPIGDMKVAAPPPPGWQQIQPARDIYVVSWSPVVYRMLDANAVNWKMTASTPPTVTITSPDANDTVTDTTRPSVVWEVSDSEGDRIDKVDVQLLDDSSNVVFSTSVTDGTVLSARSDVAIPNGDYTWSIVATEAVTGYSSDPDTVSFTVDVERPTTPTLAAASDLYDPAVTLTLSGGDNYVIEYSDDGGTTWAQLVEQTAGTYVDRTVLIRTQRQYRARVWDPDSQLDSDWSDIATGSAFLDGAWLSAPSLDQAAMPVKLKDYDPAPQRTVATFDPTGRREKIVVKDVPKGAEGTFQIWVTTADERAELEALLESGETLLMRDPHSRGWFFEVTDAVGHEIELVGPDRWGDPRNVETISVPFTEVARP